MAKKDEVKSEGEAAVVETPDSPLLDLSDAAVKRMLKIAKKRGWVTQEELNAVLPSEEISSDQIEDMNSMLSEMGINVVESEDAEEAEKESAEAVDEEEAEGGEIVEAARTTAVATRTFRARRAHRRSGAHVLARNGLGRALVARGRNRHRQADRGRARGDDRGPVREPAHLPGDHHLARRAQRRQDPAARHHRSRGDLRRAGRQEGAEDRLFRPRRAAAAQSGPRPHRAGDRARRRRRKDSRAIRSRRPKTSTTRTISRIRSRCRRWRPTSSRRCSRPSTASPTPTRSCAGCRIRTSRTSSGANRSRPPRSANTRR